MLSNGKITSVRPIYVENHHLEYNKPAEFLSPVKTGPYYAFEQALAYFTTVGGLKVSNDAQVIDKDGKVIPGLYAGGSDAGGIYGDTYDVGLAAGSQVGWAVNSGRMAAQHAATYLK